MQKDIYYEVARNTIEAEFYIFDSDPKRYIQSMGWDVKEWPNINLLAGELDYTVKDIESLADIFRRHKVTDPDDEAVSNLQSDYTANLVAEKIQEAARDLWYAIERRESTSKGWRKSLREKIANPSTERRNIHRKPKLSMGYTFKQAQELARTQDPILRFDVDVKWVLGTRDNLWHPITKEDRDFEIWGIPNDEFKHMTEQEAITNQSTGRRIRNPQQKTRYPKVGDWLSYRLKDPHYGTGENEGNIIKVLTDFTTGKPTHYKMENGDIVRMNEILTWQRVPGYIRNSYTTGRRNPRRKYYDLAPQARFVLIRPIQLWEDIDNPDDLFAHRIKGAKELTLYPDPHWKKIFTIETCDSEFCDGYFYTEGGHAYWLTIEIDTLNAYFKPY